VSSLCAVADPEKFSAPAAAMVEVWAVPAGLSGRALLLLLIAWLAWLYCGSAGAAEPSEARPKLSIAANGKTGVVEAPWGVPAHISWSSSGVRPRSCGIYGPRPVPLDASNLFNGSGAEASTNPGQDTPKLYERSVYTVACLAVTQNEFLTASVQIEPSLSYYLTRWPIAVASSLIFWALLVAMGAPRVRELIGSIVTHPKDSTQPYVVAFDTVRGLAAAMVLLGHCRWATYPVFYQTWLITGFIYGTKAVPIFAVLSGFLIYRSVLSIHSLQGLRSYAIRRFFRLYPVYAVGILLCLATGQYVGANNYTAFGAFASDVLMLNVVGWPGPIGNPPTWSLYVEVMFYALLPLIVLIIRRDRMTAFAGSLIIALIIADYPSRVFGLWKFFGFGVLASEWSPHARRVALPLCLVGVGLLAYDFTDPSHDWFYRLGITNHHEDGETVGLGLGITFVLMSLPHLGALARAMSVLPLRMLGLIS
jgi:peptidoglycan/LPS O-acetylase OafA/YrhL